MIGILRRWVRSRSTREALKASRAGQALNDIKTKSEKARYAAQHSRLAVELGRHPDAWRGTRR